MPHNELLRLVVLQQNLEDMQSEDGYRYIVKEAASIVPRPPCKSLFIAFRSRDCSGALSLHLLKQVGHGSNKIE